MTKKVSVGNIFIGGGESVKIQTMSDVKTTCVDKIVEQIEEVSFLGCDLFRVAVKNFDDAKAIKQIKNRTKMPIVADIHFDYKLGIEAINNGVDKIRINPGNIGADANLEALAKVIKDNNVAVRVGSNTGSIEKEYLEKYGKSAAALAESALKKVSLLERHGVDNIVISAKASSASLTAQTYRYLSQKTDYPLHLGVTEAGTLENGVVKSSVTMGALLLDGIGDTIRVSLTAPIAEEVITAKRILRAVGLDKNYAEVISCPTCGRTAWDLQSLVKEVEAFTAKYDKPFKIAVMGCVVNGPGEAKDCDIGIAGGDGKCVIFKKGEVYKTLAFGEHKQEFLSEIEKLYNEKHN